MLFMKNGLKRVIAGSSVGLILCLFLGNSSVFAQEAQNQSPAQQADPIGEDPGPVYTQMITQWAKVTNFAQNAAKVIVGRIKIEIQNDPKLQNILTPAFEADLEQFFYELFLSQQTIKELAKLYAQYFTLDEMQDLLKFYQSPMGQKLIKSDAEIKLKTQQIGMILFKNHQKEYMKLIAKHRGLEQKK